MSSKMTSSSPSLFDKCTIISIRQNTDHLPVIVYKNESQLTKTELMRKCTDDGLKYSSASFKEFADSRDFKEKDFWEIQINAKGWIDLKRNVDIKLQKINDNSVSKTINTSLTMSNISGYLVKALIQQLEEETGSKVTTISTYIFLYNYYMII